MLARDFLRRYKMTGSEYLTRVRLVRFIEEVRKPGATATEAAREAGYESYHNLLDALKRRTGLAPGGIRRLTHDEAHAIRMRMTLAC